MYKLPHPLDRPHQAESLEWILESDKKYLILNAPTGFGKSPLPAATSTDFRTLVLVLHKSLQSANYLGTYNFDVLYGKSNYPCNEPSEQLSKIAGITAYDCGNPECVCPYQCAVTDCFESNRVCLNYAKYLTTMTFAKNYGAKFLFLDEAHNLPEIVTEFVGITLNYDNEFLWCYGDVKPGTEGILNYGEAMSTFRQLARACERNKPRRSEDLKRWRKWKRLNTRIKIANEIFSTSDMKDWYFESAEERLLIKPLTAKYHFKRLFDTADKIVMMSATIGPGIAARLGIDKDEFDFMPVPSVWPTPTRMIYDLEAPKMNWENRRNPKIKKEQAKLIASVLRNDCSGIIHTMSKAQSYELFDLLKRMTNFRFYIPEIGIGTENQLIQWYKHRQPGTYCISWSFHEGVDLGGEDINIMAKTPYASLAGGYDQAKKDYDVNWYILRTAQTMEQIFGRHQRGQVDHYNGSKLAFIADGSWRGLKSRLSNDFKKRVRKWNGRTSQSI